MDGILQFLGGSLVRPDFTFGSALQVNVNLAIRGDVAGGRFVLEIRAVDLVVTVVVLAIYDDVNFVKFGVSGLYLHGLRGAHGKQSVSAFGLGEREGVG